jgi:hypothetical protein
MAGAESYGVYSLYNLGIANLLFLSLSGCVKQQRDSAADIRYSAEGIAELGCQWDS